MTTILGVKTEGAIIVASDTQINWYDGEKRTRRIDGSKIRILNNSYAIAHAGDIPTYLESFFTHMAKDTSDGFFEMLKKKNLLPDDLGIQNMPRDISKVRKRLNELPKERKNQLSKNEQAIKALIDLSPEKQKSLGPLDQYVLDLFRSLIDGGNQKPMERAITLQYCIELYNLNLAYSSDLEAEGIELIVAANKPNLELYFFNDKGRVSNVQNADCLDYIARGTGQENVDNYFMEEEYNDDSNIPDKYKPIRPGSISTEVGLELARAAIKHAKTKDDSTGGIVVWAVVTKDGVDDYGPMLRKALSDAEKSVMEKAKAKYRDIKKE